MENDGNTEFRDIKNREAHRTGERTGDDHYYVGSVTSKTGKLTGRKQWWFGDEKTQFRDIKNREAHRT